MQPLGNVWAFRPGISNAKFGNSKCSTAVQRCKRPGFQPANVCRSGCGAPCHSSFKKQPSFYSLVMDNSSRIESNAVINTYHGRVHMKENSRIGIGSIVIGPVEIGMNSGVSQYCFITGENREHSKTPEGLLPATTSVKKAKVTIGNGCWIGAGVTILPGVNIGDGTTIAAGAVVTNNIPPHSLAAGIPARVIRTEQPTLSKEE